MQRRRVARRARQPDQVLRADVGDEEAQPDRGPSHRPAGQEELFGAATARSTGRPPLLDPEGQADNADHQKVGGDQDHIDRGKVDWRVDAIVRLVGVVGHDGSCAGAPATDPKRVRVP